MHSLSNSTIFDPDRKPRKTKVMNADEIRSLTKIEIKPQTEKYLSIAIYTQTDNQNFNDNLFNTKLRMIIDVNNLKGYIKHKSIKKAKKHIRRLLTYFGMSKN